MITLDIESLAYGGDAIARLNDGRTAFVSGACPGDRVVVEIAEDHGRFVKARVVGIESPSPDRVQPPCPYFGVCGGCTWQHVTYAAQLASKRRSVVDALQRLGRIADAASLVTDPIAAPHEYGYRNKIELVPDPTDSRPFLGYHRAASEEVVRVEECLLLPKKLRKAPRSLSGALRYVSGEVDLGIHRVGLRTANHTRDLEIAIWTSTGGFPRKVAAKTLAQALPATSVVRVLTKGAHRARKVTGVEVLSGKGAWTERLGGYDYFVSAPSFFQVNTAVAESMVERVIDLLDPDGTDRVLDLYAGAGTFTLPLAERAGDVVAVEAAGPAVRDLRRNLERNELWADVLGGDAARELPGLGHFDLALVDPPRSGLAAGMASALAAGKPRRIGYVSCDPATLARDAALLAGEGYRLAVAVPVDLFPQTYHVETVALFERTKAS